VGVWGTGISDFGTCGDLVGKYDIVAKTATPVLLDRMKLMLQTLLAERLNLATHRGTKEIPVYALAPAKSGPKLHKTAGEQKSALNRLSTLVFVGRPVIDRTGFEGVFDFTLRFGATNEEMRRVTLDGDGASFFTLIQEQLGLKLEPRKSAVETIVVDRADKAPKSP
jgi:hypothetical protein